jgi:hypothetical protein
MKNKRLTQKRNIQRNLTFSESLIKIPEFDRTTEFKSLSTKALIFLKEQVRPQFALRTPEKNEKNGFKMRNYCYDSIVQSALFLEHNRILEGLSIFSCLKGQLENIHQLAMKNPGKNLLVTSNSVIKDARIFLPVRDFMQNQDKVGSIKYYMRDYVFYFNNKKTKLFELYVDRNRDLPLEIVKESITNISKILGY